MSLVTILLVIQIPMLIALIILIGYLYSRSKKLSEDLRDVEKKRKEIIEHATNQATHIVDEAMDESQKITGVKENIQVKAEEHLSHIEQEVSKELEEKSQQLLTKMSDQIGHLEADEVKIMKDSLTNQLKVSQEQVNSYQKEALAKIDQEMQRYKDEQIQKAQQEVQKWVLKVSKEILGNTLTPEQHEQLIFEALKKAKNENKI